jgi:NADPH:quinone reductase-like Zn-dependent oxidoreductase
MRAIVQDQYGSTDQLHLRDLPAPAPGAGTVRIRVRAAGVDRGTVHLMTGLPLLMRPAVGFRGPRRPTPGLALAGVVDAVGEGVTNFSVGDEVVGTGRGSFAELTIARADRLVVKPAALSFEEAAALPVSGVTALEGVKEVGRAAAGQRVLVIGASGGVGCYAVQIAKALETEVTAVASAAKLDLVRDLGADHVIDYAAGELAESTSGIAPFDLILDIGGNRPLHSLRRLLTPRGTLLIVGGENGTGRVLSGLQRMVGAALLSPLVRHRMPFFIASDKAPPLQSLLGLVHRGLVRPVVDEVFELADAAKAIRYLEEGRTRGKVVVRVD